MGVFELPESELDFGLGAVAGDDVGDGPVLVVGEQDPFAEHLVFQCPSSVTVDVPGEPVLGGGVAGQVAVDDAAQPRVVGDGGDLGLDGGPVAAGFAAGQGRGEFVQQPPGFGQGGAGEGAGLVLVQRLGVGEHDPAGGAVDDTLGVDGAQAGVTVHRCAPGGGPGEQVGAVTGRDR